jgi:putative pyruvate formate lyase activating enzyme
MKIENKIKQIEAILDHVYNRLGKCDICPRDCGVNRLKGEMGYCGAAEKLVVYTAFLHRGEEPAISGECGSGTIFFSGCNLKCVYCQNYKFSHSLKGKIMNEEKLAKIMLKLQDRGAHNINLVTPTHFLPQILKALLIAFKNGLTLPIVYNTSGYEKEEIIESINDIVDVYLIDMKYVISSLAKIYSHTEHYPFVNQKSIKKICAIKENVWNEDLMRQGVIVRHLVLPSHFEETIRVLSWVKENTPNAILSLMFQYQPYFKAKNYPELARRVNDVEYQQIKSFLEDFELDGWVQDLEPDEHLAGVHFDSTLDDLLDPSE